MSSENYNTWRIIEKDQLEMQQLEMQQLKKQLDEKRAENEKVLQIAKELKAIGMDDAAIKKVTGLKLGEIKKL